MRFEPRGVDPVRDEVVSHGLGARLRELPRVALVTRGVSFDGHAANLRVGHHHLHELIEQRQHGRREGGAVSREVGVAQDADVLLLDDDAVRASVRGRARLLRARVAHVCDVVVVVVGVGAPVGVVAPVAVLGLSGALIA